MSAPSIPTFAVRPFAASGAIALALMVCAGATRQALADDPPLPAGFELVEIASGLSNPVALAEAADGRLFVAEQGGAVRIVRGGVVEKNPFITIDVYASTESGLLGIALDPNFATNGHVYAFATVSRTEQRIYRFTAGETGGTELTVVRGDLPCGADLHNGGGLRTGPDGKLWFSIGDAGEPALAARLDTFAGKLCRINLDGSVPDDNPLSTPTGTRRAIYALGFRNPFRFCFASDGRLFLGDVGSEGDGRREELNLITPGGNYGWPAVEGDAEAPAGAELQRPLLAYHDEGGSITGCAFYDGKQFPAEYAGNVFHLDFVSRGLFRVELDGDRVIKHVLFARTESSASDLIVARDGSLLYPEVFTGRIVAVRYRGGAPTAGGATDEPGASGEGSSEPPVTGSQAACGAGSAGVMALAGPAVALCAAAASRRRRP